MMAHRATVTKKADLFSRVTYIEQPAPVARRLLRMRDDRENIVRVTLNPKKEPPASVNPGLPAVRGLVILFGPEGRVPEVGKEKAKLFVELGFQSRRKCGVLCGSVRRDDVVHFARRGADRTPAF